MGCMVGYARVSTSDQDVSLQWEALRRAGCQESHIFCDTASGAHTARPGLAACFQAFAPGVMLVVWRFRHSSVPQYAAGRMTEPPTCVPRAAGTSDSDVRYFGSCPFG